jgi:predicted RNA-binding Zn ribbon-like protein
MASQHTQPLTWDAGSFIGGSLCLDFCNTQGGRTKARDLERLTSYQAAVSWASAAHGSSASEAQTLRQMAQAAPELARRSLEELQVFRESLHCLISALVAGEAPEPADLERLRAAICAAISAAALLRHETGVSWVVAVDATGLKTLAARIALSAQQLLSSDEVVHVRECERCSWLFVDRSKNKLRRWCNTQTCGNRARAARHYQMSKA